ncbi:MAG: DUF262 domain-containing protein [Planctomycetes bacterium]|nr:DUF262 domain-containing protein [Planctomycetota bacterium]
MDAGTLSIGKIFGQDRRYLVPLFQRPYVWNEDDQWEPLWDDVRSVAERLVAGQETRPHFLGAIVLDQMRKPTGQVETRLVIDGQQRLTTIQIMLEAFADLAGELKQEKLHKALLKLTRNDDPMSEDPDEVFKVWPTNVDRDVFRWVMSEGSPLEVRERLAMRANQKRAGLPVPDAYFYFHDAISEWIAPGTDGTEVRAETLLKALKDYLRLVVIDLGKDDDAQLIFETLNARGTPLLPSDLVKNHLFHRADLDGANLESLYERWWRPFDADAAYWREQVGKGRTKRARIDIFLQDFLTLQARDEVRIAHLYDAFRGHLSKHSERTVAQHLEQLHHYAQIFQRFDAMPEGSPEAEFFERLRAVEMTTAHPFLLELFSKHGKHTEAVRRILTDVGSYFVRRMVCQLTTKNYNRLFIDSLRILEFPSDKVAEAFREHLAVPDGESVRWPKDSEFREAWLTTPLYKSLSRGRLQMLILALESRASTGKTERVRYEDGLTVEHLMPQNWEKHWPLPDGVDSEEAEELRSRMLHTIGNLTLLTDKLNPAASNAAWPKKREVILKHSILKLNLRLKDADEWDEESIRDRGAELFEHAKVIWPRPALVNSKS